MGDYRSLLGLDGVKDIWALTIHNIKLSQERQVEQFLAYSIPEFYVGKKLAGF